MISSSVSRSPSISASTSADVRSSDGFLRRSFDHVGVVDQQLAEAWIASAGTSDTPSSRCMTPSASARMRTRSSSGTPMSSEMTSIGSLPAKSSTKSKRVRLQRRVEMLDGDLDDAGLQLANSPWREALRDQSAQPEMPGIVEGEERHHPVRLVVAGDRVERNAVPVGQRRAVAEALHDVGVPRQRPELLLFVAIERGLVAQPLVVRVRVLVEVVVVRIE